VLIDRLQQHAPHRLPIRTRRRDPARRGEDALPAIHLRQPRELKAAIRHDRLDRVRRRPITLIPLTLSHDHLLRLIRSIQPASGDEDGTAIGDAVALAAARFKEAETAAGGQLKSKVIVLLTDGQNNMGRANSGASRGSGEAVGAWRVYAIGIHPGVADSRYDPDDRDRSR